MCDRQYVWSPNRSYRRHRTAQWQEEMAKGWQVYPWRSVATALSCLEDFQMPQFPNQIEPCVDAVATVLADPPSRRCIAFMDYNPHSSTSPTGRISGVGKTSAALHLLGFRSIAANQNRQMFSFDFSPTRLRLIASDMGFFCAENGALTFSPAVGELGLCAWDFVRFLGRLASDEENESKLRLLRHLPDYYPTFPVLTIRAAIRAPCRITDIVAFDETEIIATEEASMTLVDEPADRRAILHNCLCDGLRQPSANWLRSAESHSHTAGLIVEELQQLPQVWISRRRFAAVSPDASFRSRVRELTRLINRRKVYRSPS